MAMKMVKWLDGNKYQDEKKFLKTEVTDDKWEVINAHRYLLHMHCTDMASTLDTNRTNGS